MGSGLSRPAKALVLASGGFLTRCVGLISAAVLSRVFDLEQYGTYRQVFLAIDVVMPLLVLGMPQSLYYFLPGEEEAPRRVLCENLLLLFAGGGIFTAFLALGGNQVLARSFSNPQLTTALLVFAAYPLFAMPRKSVSACLMARDRPTEVALFNVGSKVLVVAAVLTAALVYRSVVAVLLGMLFAVALNLLGALGLMFKACPGPTWKPTLSGVKAQLKFAIPLGIGGVVGGLAAQFGQVVVSAMCTTDEYAIYANGAVQVPMIGMIAGSVTAVITPDLARHWKGGEKAQLLRLWQSALIKCSALLIPIMVFLMITAEDVMQVVFSAKYAQSALPFRILLLLVPLRGASYTAVFLATNRGYLLLIRTVLNVIVVVTVTVCFVAFFGAWGAAAAVVVSTYGVLVPFSVLFISRITETDWWRVLPVRRLAVFLFASLLSAVPACGAVFLLSSQPPVVRLMASASLYAGTALVVFRVAGIHEAFEIIRSLRYGRKTSSPLPESDV